jgi:hypothetical protein
MLHIYEVLIGGAIIIVACFYILFRLIDTSYVNNPLLSKRSFPSLHRLGSKVFGSRDNITV